ncbi:Sarcosine oxidase subunit alpha [subsurface metagenome]
MKSDLRIENHPILEFKRGKKITFQFEGKQVEGYENESIAAALFASGVKVFSHSKRFNNPKGWFCGIGKCCSCLMRVDGIPNVRTCVVPVREGMQVERQGQRAMLPSHAEIDVEREEIDVQALIIGGGPAGLGAGITAGQLGLSTVIIDENHNYGGQLIKQTHKFFGSKEEYAGLRGFEISDIMYGEFMETGGVYLNETSAVGYYGKKNNKHIYIAYQRREDGYTLLEISAKYIVVTTGAFENYLSFPGNYLPGVYGAGGVQTLMNVYGVRPGKKALIVGAGNIGLIVGYQLLQAGVEVKALIDALPKIGGYLVHASKLKRLGVPIYTSHTIKNARGKESVEGATIVELDKNMNPVKGTEKDFEVDLILIAVGLSASNKILSQIGCKNTYVKEMGAWLPIHNEYMETTIEGIYLAGDAGGIAEASTAMLEGKLAGAAIAEKEGCDRDKIETVKKTVFGELSQIRESEFLRTIEKGKKRCHRKWEEVKKA